VLALASFSGLHCSPSATGPSGNAQTDGTASGTAAGTDPAGEGESGAPTSTSGGTTSAGGDTETAGDSTGGEIPEPALELIGHSPLGARGANSAMTILGEYAYVGSRSDGNHPDNGVLIVDIEQPNAPVVAGELIRPDEDNDRVSSREIRGLVDQDLLIVFSISCSENMTCSGSLPEAAFDIRFYDVGDPLSPQEIGYFDYPEGGQGHEFFAWQDPEDAERTLLYIATNGPDPMLIVDISDPTAPQQIAEWNVENDAELHSVALSNDGKTAYLSYKFDGVFLADTSDFALGLDDPEIRRITNLGFGAAWTNGSGKAHSAVPVPDRDIVLATDEEYDCPYGWVHMVEIGDPEHPSVVGEFQLPENEPCDESGPFSSHNPTVTSHLAFVTWYAGGLLVLDTTDPENPQELVRYSPEPLPEVGTEDTQLEGNHIGFWSYPIIRDGLIYAVDIRNGLYIFRYRGPHQAEVEEIEYREGNSNRIER
jgi:hypothetical protein